jgi:hypothetical protein
LWQGVNCHDDQTAGAADYPPPIAAENGGDRDRGQHPHDHGDPAAEPADEMQGDDLSERDREEMKKP